MSQVAVVVEGQTEEAVIDGVLAPAAAARGVYLQAIIVRTSATQRGGGHWKHYDRLLRVLLAQPHWARVGLAVDYYGYPQGAPGRGGSGSGEDTRRALTSALTDTYTDPRFHPLVIPHEIEALVLAALDAGAGDGILPAAGLRTLRQAVKDAGGAERVNTGADRSPSKRLQRADPDYSKTVTGPLLIEEAGLPAILERCPTVASWWDGLVAMA